MRVVTSTFQICDTFVTNFLKMQHLRTKIIIVFLFFRMYLIKSILFLLNFALGLQMLLKVVIIARRCLLFWQVKRKLILVKIPKTGNVFTKINTFGDEKSSETKKYWFRCRGVTVTFQNCDTFVTDFLKSNDLPSKITTFRCLGAMNFMKTWKSNDFWWEVWNFWKKVFISLQRGDSDIELPWYIRTDFLKSFKNPTKTFTFKWARKSQTPN